MAETPYDVILQILAKLGVKSLLRFNCVSKKWYSTISDPQFYTKLHQMLPSVLICQNSKTFSTITIESLSKKNSAAPSPLSLPWETEDNSRNIPHQNHLIGSSNGVVCVDYDSKSGRRLIFWNPSTRKFRRLPPSPPGSYTVQRGYSYYAWFGYDESIRDYKLVWLSYHSSHKELYVFTRKSHCWRHATACIDDNGLQKGHDTYNSRIIGVLSNGAIHWRTCKQGRMVILALDLATEKFQVLNFCNYPFDPRIGGSCILGGCPCAYDDQHLVYTHDGMALLHMVKEYCSSVEGVLSPDGGSRRFYQTLFSKEESKEILAVIDTVCSSHHRRTYGDKIVKLRIGEGGEGSDVKVSFAETLLQVPKGSPNGSCTPCKNNIVLHFEESLVSLCAAAADQPNVY